MGPVHVTQRTGRRADGTAIGDKAEDNKGNDGHSPILET